MKIELKLEIRAEFMEVEVEPNLLLDDLYRMYEKQTPYTVLAAKVDNEVRPLTDRLNRECRVEFLDMRTQAANVIYQNSLILLYLKAIQDVIGDVSVDIENSLIGVKHENSSVAQILGKFDLNKYFAGITYDELISVMF